MFREKLYPHPESCLHLGLEDVTFQVVWEHRWRSGRVQRLFRKLLLFSLQGATKENGKETWGTFHLVSRTGKQHVGNVSDLVVNVDVQRGPRRRITL